MQEYSYDEDYNSPLVSAGDLNVYGGSPLSEVFLEKAEKISPRREEIESRREALMSAYKNLMNMQQQYKQLPDDLQLRQAAGMLERTNDPTLKALNAPNLAAIDDLERRFNASKEGDINSSITGLKMNQENLGFLDQDQKNEIDLLKSSGLMDYRNDMMQQRMLLQALKHQVPTISDNSSLAAEMGVPAYSGPDPYERLDKTGQRQLRMKYEKQLEKIQDSEVPGAEYLNDIKRFRDLNESVKKNWIGTGPLADWIPNTSKELQEMGAIASRIVPKMRPAGSGSTSDKDMELFKKAAFGTDKDYEVNRNIATAWIISKENELAKGDFFESYLSANGHLRGAQKAWKEYLNANPIFAGDSENFSLNDDRKTWEDFFSGDQIVDGEAFEGDDIEPDQVDLDFLPPVPDGYSKERWKKIWGKMSSEQKELFLR